MTIKINYRVALHLKKVSSQLFISVYVSIFIIIIDNNGFIIRGYIDRGKLVVNLGC